MRQRNMNRGFTLIEMIVVILIIGILALAALPFFIDLRRVANEAATQGSLGAIRSAVHMYYAHTSMVVSPQFPSLNEMNTNTSVIVPSITETLWTTGRPINYLNGRLSDFVGALGTDDFPPQLIPFTCSPTLENPNGWTYWPTNG